MENREPLKPYLLTYPGPLRDQLVAAVLSGEEVSTTGLLAEYEVIEARDQGAEPRKPAPWESPGTKSGGD